MTKTIIYQLLPRTFANFCTNRKNNGTIQENGCGKFNLITTKALREIKNLGATHVWYTGVIEHATQTDYSEFGITPDHPSVVKGKAGSPYAIKDYYDVDPDLAENVDNRMAEFEALIERTHKVGLKVIIDFVPNHVARQYHSDAKPAGIADLGEGDNPEWAFSPLNNFYYIPGEKFAPAFDVYDYTEDPAKVTGNDCFTAHPGHNDWYETIKLNYGVFYQGGGEKQFNPIPSTWLKMRDILRFWAAKGVDGFRCDMAEMVPVEFWEWVIPQIKDVEWGVTTTDAAGKKTYKKKAPIIFIAEVYNPALYREFIFKGHFDYLYDKVGMYDYLRAVTSKNYPVEGITQQWQAVGDIQEHMLYFLENHDEQRIASGFFCGRGMCAQPAMIVAATLSTNPVMIYAGQELGEKGMDVEGFSGIDGRTTIFDYWGVKSIQAWANNGKWDGKGLDDEQQELRLFYQQLLTLTRNSKAITEGKMYDLEYAQAEGFNKHEHYAYLRHCEEETLLIAINFDDKHAEMQIRIPAEAFAYLHIQPCTEVQFTDLLSGQTFTRPFLPNTPITLSLEAWKGMILKID
ncbi:MAG: alpha-amylase family glycosyl hydrolase [Bacteroidales bacterium]|nr:alpha-amylase family glycosyl hydrolase [Bacteroidales bacterium]